MSSKRKVNALLVNEFDAYPVPLSCSRRRRVLKEETPPSEDEDEKTSFSWRGDPSENHSDWTIEVCSDHDGDGSTTIKVYHVHKFMLSCGKNRSEYFARIFRKGTFKESEQGKSRLELASLAAGCFPDLLDYVYKPHSPPKITSQTATALYYLADYFEMKHLRWDALQFLKKDMSCENVGTYYEHAALFNNEKILEIVTSFLGSNIQEIKKDSSLLKMYNPQLWTDALDFMNTQNKSAVKHASILVAEFLKVHSEKIDGETYHQLTDSSRLPHVDPSVALQLCHFEDEHKFTESSTEEAESSSPKKKNKTGKTKKKQTKPRQDDSSDEKNVKGGSELSSLQKRCITALTKTWKDIDISDEATYLLLVERSPTFFIEILGKCLDESKNALTACEEKLKAAEKKSKPRPRGRQTATRFTDGL